MEPQTKLSVPVAIIIAGLVIGGAVLYNGRQSQTGSVAAVAANQPGPGYSLGKMRPLSATDHRRGAASPKLVVVEYSDLECPYCKGLQQSMQEVMKTYGDRVAWVYRQFPLDKHPQAQKEAEASECVAKLGGNDAFWKFVDNIFAVTPSNNGLDLTLMPGMAEKAGVSKTDFETCLNSGQMADLVKADLNNGIDIGVDGTPFSVLVKPNGTKTELVGYLPVPDLKAKLDKALAS